MGSHAVLKDRDRADAVRRRARMTGLALAALALFFMVSVGVVKLWGKL